ncbi:MAG: helix-turn-helix domain-containing protein [Morganella morganii]
MAGDINISQQQVSRYECGYTGFQLDVLFDFFSALRMDENEIQHFFCQVVRKAGGMPKYNLRKAE